MSRSSPNCDFVYFCAKLDSKFKSGTACHLPPTHTHPPLLSTSPAFEISAIFYIQYYLRVFQGIFLDVHLCSINLGRVVDETSGRRLGHASCRQGFRRPLKLSWETPGQSQWLVIYVCFARAWLLAMICYSTDRDLPPSPMLCFSFVSLQFF